MLCYDGRSLMMLDVSMAILIPSECYGVIGSWQIFKKIVSTVPADILAKISPVAVMEFSITLSVLARSSQEKLGFFKPKLCYLCMYFNSLRPSDAYMRR